MRFKTFKDYELLDTSNGERLERWGNVILIRPDPQIIWDTRLNTDLWYKAHAKYHRSNSGGGYWEKIKNISEPWQINYEKLTFNLKLMNFKHTGIFPEQATNWDLVADIIKKSGRKLKILNLFGYTGAATLSAAQSGAKICHVDASKGMVGWAKENALASNLSDKPVRWIVDDCEKFVKREIRRGNKYDGIIMDPPSYGRGPSGEIWTLEKNLFSFVSLCAEILSNDAEFFLLNSYTTGLSPSTIMCILDLTLKQKFGGTVHSDEIGLPVTYQHIILPCGSTAFWKRSS